jgi:membrane associated rhomboid family serine protease
MQTAPACGKRRGDVMTAFHRTRLVKREPILNIPGVVAALIGIFLLVHVVREYALSEQIRDLFDATFAFNPLRYEPSLLVGGGLPGGFGAEIWTFVSYAFIHASFLHLGVNAIWFLPFGSAVARRFGALRFILFFAVTAAAGALAHLFTHVGQNDWVIGASASISGMMAGAMRFAFQHGGPLGFWRSGNDDAYRVPAVPLSGVLRDSRILAFLIVWFGLNFLSGLGSLPITGSEQPIAWQAHIGGFLAGLLLFSWFDPALGDPQADDIGAARY